MCLWWVTNFDMERNFFQWQKLWAVITGITMQELFWYFIVLVSDFHCVWSITGLQTTIHKQCTSLFALCTWQTNTTNFTQLHSHSTSPPFYFQKSYSIFGAGITQFGTVTGQSLDSQPIKAWILEEERNLSLLITLNSSRCSFPRGMYV
jgi:hypothetical protein